MAIHVSGKGSPILTIFFKDRREHHPLQNPFLFQPEVMTSHFENLMDLSVSAQLDLWSENCKRWKRFLDIMSFRKRSGKSKDKPAAIARILKTQQDLQLSDVKWNILVCALAIELHKDIPEDTWLVRFQVGEM